jgi:hypothetical protein
MLLFNLLSVQCVSKLCRIILRLSLGHEEFRSWLLQLVIPSKRSKLRIKLPKDFIFNGQWIDSRQDDNAL